MLCFTVVNDITFSFSEGVIQVDESVGRSGSYPKYVNRTTRPPHQMYSHLSGIAHRKPKEEMEARFVHTV